MTALLILGCAPTKRVYRVEFADGTFDYYELKYKPKDGATSIKYNGETIIGVTKIEQIDNEQSIKKVEND